MKKILLENTGNYALVDDEDYDLVMSFGKWHENDSGYAVRRDTVGGKKQTVRMHREVNATPHNMVTDHKNGNRLDNRKSNLRSVTQRENMANLKNVKGYCWDAQKKMWMVRHNRKFYGRYKTEPEAIEAVKLARSGVPKPSRVHPRRMYLPRGVYFMQPRAQKGYSPYYIRPRKDGVREFKGYFRSVDDALATLRDMGVQKERIAS